MKKKLLLGILAVCLTFIGLNGVKADGGPVDELIANGNVTYQTYTSGESIMFDFERLSLCSNVGGSCKTYTITGDEGENDGVVVLTDSDSNSMNMSKDLLAIGYKLSATSEVKFKTDPFSKNKLNVDSDNLTYIKFYKDASDIVSDLNNASNYDTFVQQGYVEFQTTSLTIPKNVTYVGVPDVNNLKVNGRLVTGHVYGSISGTGTIELNYKYEEGYLPGPNPEISEKAIRFSPFGISGVKINVVEDTVKEGLVFGYPGYVEYYNEQEAQNFIDMYNNVFEASYPGYTLKLKKTNEGQLDFYYGVVSKKENTSSTSNTASNVKKAVKNPKTGDTLFAILGAITLAGAGFIVTIKKAKQK